MENLSTDGLQHIDIDRLHQNTEEFERGKLLLRGSGKTTVIIEKLIGSALVSPPGSSFLVLCHSSNHVHYMAERVLTRLRLMGERSLVRRTREDILLSNGTHLMFSVPSQVSQQVRGIRLTNFFIDDYDEFLRLYIDKADDILAFLETRCV